MTELYGVFKLAAALALYLFLDPRLAGWAEPHGHVGSIVAEIVNITVSAAVVYAVTGRLLQRPRLTVNWVHDRVETAGPCVQLTHSAANFHRIRVFDLQLRYEGSSLLAKGLAGLCKHRGATVVMSLVPDQVAIVVLETSGVLHNTASVTSPTTVTFAVREPQIDVVTSWIEVSLEAHPNCGALSPVKCRYSIQVGGLWGWLSKLLVPVSSPVEMFELRRA
ncbi:hypothetical protein CH273_02175 [Rhodococcus sp. 05-339-2]|uniref:hypothetical protein n=1 Tax=Rhodococcoides fascians TaxID=1828 RepID=UPI00050CE12C|nr:MULTISPECIES: hypothetical protein [Rhodococcus]OZD85587.1 hypothetical protein CH273_02175 [Rhodococcus sp. 05-339-2]